MTLLLQVRVKKSFGFSLTLYLSSAWGKLGFHTIFCLETSCLMCLLLRFHKTFYIFRAISKKIELEQLDNSKNQTGKRAWFITHETTNVLEAVESISTVR